MSASTELIWKTEMRPILRVSSSPEKERLCQSMISSTVTHFFRPDSLNFDVFDIEKIKNYVSDLFPIDFRDFYVLEIVSSHSQFILIRGWNSYYSEMTKPENVNDADLFLTDDSFDDYDQ